MPNTVDAAFYEFMRDTVDLDPAVVKNARLSRDNLLENIAEFDGDEDFFKLFPDYNIHFGSFARKTKCRELNDIDLMIGISADKATYSSDRSWNDIRIQASSTNQAQKECSNDDGTLNSTKVANRFKKKLENLWDYSRSSVRQNAGVVVLELLSKDWSFDIVPCFHTVKEHDGRNYYLVPNEDGNWMKTDPTIDRAAVLDINRKHHGKVLELIRLVKKWNYTKHAHTIPSYLLETLMLNYCKGQSELSKWIDCRFRDALKYIQLNIHNQVLDPKGIQGDINTLTHNERVTLSDKAKFDYVNSNEAITYEVEEKNHQKSINKWREVFREGFPHYE